MDIADMCSAETAPKALDLFCGAGGASMGLSRAGFEVVGVDIEPQPHYPFRMYTRDALTMPVELIRRFDLVWASPPCQFASRLTPPERRELHDNLIPRTRELLREAGVPYIIENVEGAEKHLEYPLMLCGTMFGLKVWRHRLFETSYLCLTPGPCRHEGEPIIVSGRGSRVRDGGRSPEYLAHEKAEGLGIDWMTTREMDEAIPPAYSEYLGREFLLYSGKAA